MPGRVRPQDQRLIRLSDTMLGKVEHLARLAGVSASDVVEFVLIEVFDGDGFLDPSPPDGREADPPLRKPGASVPSRSPADVISITRRRRNDHDLAARARRKQRTIDA
jgi:hypothetical protein